MSRRLASSAYSFRDTFTFGKRDVTQWFPGHMHKGMKQMLRKLNNVDCVIEVHDARIPFSGRNPMFNDMISLRPYVLILNKIDLADMTYREQIDAKLKADGVSKVLYTNCKQQMNHAIKKQVKKIKKPCLEMVHLQLIPTVTELINSQPRYHREEAYGFNLLIMGVPNVGKSSLINALRNIHLQKRKAAPVGAIAGVTKSVMEKIKVSEDPLIYLYDSPGIMSPKIKDIDIGMKLALCATLRDHLVGPDTIADYMLYWMNKNKRFEYIEHFGLSEPTDEILGLLNHVAMQRKCVQKVRGPQGGYVYRPNFLAAAQMMICEFREGRLGKVMLDIDCLPT